MDYLLIFITGMLFVGFVTPILDALSAWIQNCLTLKSVKLQVEADKLQGDEAKEEDKQIIGFQCNSYNEPVIDEDDE